LDRVVVGEGLIWGRGRGWFDVESCGILVVCVWSCGVFSRSALTSCVLLLA